MQPTDFFSTVREADTIVLGLGTRPRRAAPEHPCAQLHGQFQLDLDTAARLAEALTQAVAKHGSNPRRRTD